MTMLDEESLLPVAVETLMSSDRFEFDLYARGGRKEKPELFRRQSHAVSASDLEALRGGGVRTLYIPSTSRDVYQSYLKNHLLSNESASAQARLCAFQEINRSLFLNALRNNPVDFLIDAASRFGQDVAELVCHHEGVARDLFAVLNHDHCTFTHLTNVCVYSIVLAKGLSIRDPGQLAQIAIGALLHDVGKRHIPPAILNKPGRLTEAETRLIRNHPRDGFRELCSKPNLSWSQLMMIYQHHERLDGQGYPVQIDGDEIDPWARICAITDVFDGLTGCRANVRPKTPSDALQFLVENSGTAFDREMVACWSETVKTAG